MEDGMREVIRRVDRCRVCGLDDWLEVTDFGDMALANGFLDPSADLSVEARFPMELIACRGCWLVSMRHVVDPEVLFRHFVWVSSDSDQMLRHNQQVVEWTTEKAGLIPGSVVVEMGSNVGTQLAMFAEAGFHTIGVDPARNLAEIANERGVPTIADFFGPQVAEPILRDHGRADLVLGRQCFAHIDDVHNVLDGVDAVLAPEGVLVIEVPYLLDLVEESQFDTIYHEHLSYYSAGTFKVLFESHGFRLIDVERARVHGGSILVFAARADSSHEPAPAVARILAKEERAGLCGEQAFLEFGRAAKETIGAVGDFVRARVAEGARVAGYGCPSKGTTLLQACGLTTAEVDFVSDNTPFKQGKLLPGTHIPVRSPEEAREAEPDYYLLLAWNYAEEIVAKERAYLDRGGKFIVPIPWPRVVTAADRDWLFDGYRKAG